MSINIVNQRSHRLINIIFAIVLFLVIAVSSVVFYKSDYIANKTVELISQQIPAYDLLRKLNNTLIENEPIDNKILYQVGMLQQLETIQTPMEWKKMGLKFLKRSQLNLALECFKKCDEKEFIYKIETTQMALRGGEKLHLLQDYKKLKNGDPNFL